MKHEPAVQPSYYSFFDVDARSEICHVPSAAVTACPRIGEQVEYRADVEEGGGLYTVVNVRHVLERETARTVAIVRIVVELKPIHSASLEEGTVAVEIPVEELIRLPIAPDVVAN